MALCSLARENIYTYCTLKCVCDARKYRTATRDVIFPTFCSSRYSAIVIVAGAHHISHFHITFTTPAYISFIWPWPLQHLCRAHHKCLKTLINGRHILLVSVDDCRPIDFPLISSSYISIYLYPLLFRCSLRRNYLYCAHGGEIAAGVAARDSERRRCGTEKQHNTNSECCWGIAAVQTRLTMQALREALPTGLQLPRTPTHPFQRVQIHLPNPRLRTKISVEIIDSGTRSLTRGEAKEEKI